MNLGPVQAQLQPAAYDRDNERAFSVEQAQAAPHLIHNLLNDLAGLGSLLAVELRRGAWLNAFLLAAGMNQIAEDFLHPDPLYLGKIAKTLDQTKPPFGRFAGKFVRAFAAALVRVHGYLPSTRRVMRWQTGMAQLTLNLAEAAIAPASGLHIELQDAGEDLVARRMQLPVGLRREVLRLPSCFRAFDQQPADMRRLVQEFSQRWQERDKPLIVVGIRTSGNYLAPLIAASLKESGYKEVQVITLRPGRDLLRPELALLRAGIRRDGLVLLTDDPPVTGSSLVKSASELARIGAPTESIILMLQLFETRSSLPPALQKYSSVLLPYDEWVIHEQLTPSAIQSALENFINPAFQVTAVERLPLPPRKSGRSHIHALYQVQLAFRESGRHWWQRIFVRGVGLGYFGEFSMVVARPLQQFLPKVYGYHENLFFSEWLPDEKRLSSIAPGKEQSFADKVATYTAIRHRALRTERDLSESLFSEGPAWEVASTVLSEIFGRGALFARVPIVDPLVRRLLQVKHPSVVDGRMSLSHWFTDEKGRGLLKAEFDEATFSNDIELTCFDPVFDLASLVASMDLVRSANDFQIDDWSRTLRQAYEQLSLEAIDAERWMMYELVHLWDRQHTDRDEKNRVKRASARVMQRYFSEVYLKGVTPSTNGELVAIDLDGVLESQPLGFLSTTPAGALTLRALVRHGYRIVIATGRSLDEVKERCETYGLAGGVAEYGAVVYNHATKSERQLVSDGARAELDLLRETLREIEGVFIDDDYRFAVRAFCRDAAGRRRFLDPQLVANTLAQLRLEERVRPIVGESQTDFRVNGIDKGSALRILADVIATPSDARGKQSPNATKEIASSHPSTGSGSLLAMTSAKPFALAVGDSASDLPMLELASLPCAPANAGSHVKSSGAKIMRQPYQAGLARAVSLLLGHKPGSCPTCRVPQQSENTRLLLTILAAQESGTWNLVWSAARVGMMNAAKARES